MISAKKCMRWIRRKVVTGLTSSCAETYVRDFVTEVQRTERTLANRAGKAVIRLADAQKNKI